MGSQQERAQQIRDIIARFRTAAAETDNPFFRELMQRTAHELESAAEALDAERQHQAA